MFAKTSALSIALGLLLASSLVSAREYGGGKAGKFKRPAMAARSHFPAGFITRARTVGTSRDGKLAFVVARDKHGELWNIEVDRASGRNRSQLKHVRHYALQDARFWASEHQDKGIPAQFIKARSLGLTRSHKNLRVLLPGTRLGAKPEQVLAGTRNVFFGGVRADPNVRRDPTPKKIRPRRPRR